MRLTEFLLARIAEDRDAWLTAGRFMDTLVGPDLRNRMLAECEAKRRIAEWHSEREDCCEERYGGFTFDAEPEITVGTDSMGGLTVRRSIGTERYIGCVTLMHLAAVYAEHPDFRQEWGA